MAFYSARHATESTNSSVTTTAYRISTSVSWRTLTRTTKSLSVFVQQWLKDNAMRARAFILMYVSILSSLPISSFANLQKRKTRYFCRNIANSPYVVGLAVQENAQTMNYAYSFKSDIFDTPLLEELTKLVESNLQW